MAGEAGSVLLLRLPIRRRGSRPPSGSCSVQHAAETRIKEMSSLDDTERQLFLENGYLHARDVLDTGYLAHLRDEFDRVWQVEEPPVSQRKLLQHRAFLDLIEHPPI